MLSFIVKLQAGLSIFTACFESLFFLGILFGFSSLQFVLEKEGYFQYLCSNQSEARSNYTNTDDKNVTLNMIKNCASQQASFNLVFTLSYSAQFLFSFPSGYVFDKYGTWTFRTIMTTLYTLGYVLLSASTQSTSFFLYPSFIFIGIAGYGLHTSNFQTANFSKSFRSLILTFLEGLFDSSVIVFLLIKKGYDFGTNLSLILQILTGLTIFLWMRTYLLLPKKVVPFPIPLNGISFGWAEWKCCDDKRRDSKEVKSVSQSVASDCTNKSITENTLSRENLEKTSLKNSLKNFIFWSNVFHYSVITLRLSFLISSLLAWLRTFTDPEQISKLTDDFGFILLFGAITSPVNGLVIDGLKRFLKSRKTNKQLLNLQTSFASLLITSIFSISMSVTAIFQSVYATFLFSFFTRSFVHGSKTVFLASNFPSKDFGKLYGLVSLSAGLVGLLQFAIFQISLNFDPTFYYINVGFLISTLLTLLHPVAIAVKIRSVKFT